MPSLDVRRSVTLFKGKDCDKDFSRKALELTNEVESSEVS